MERSLIESIASELRARGSRVVRGIGDDAAVVRARPICVTSVDTVVEGVHFRLGDPSPDFSDIGWRALAGALSDLAAMGAEAGEAYLALGVPSHVGERHALELMRGAEQLAADHRNDDRRGRCRGRARPVCERDRRRLGRVRELVGRDGAQRGSVGVTGGSAARAALAVIEGVHPRGSEADGVRRARSRVCARDARWRLRERTR